MPYPYLLESCRGVSVTVATKERQHLRDNSRTKTRNFVNQMLRPQRSVIAWKGEAFGYKNLGQAAKLIVRMLRPYSTVRLVGKG
jgi:hypothetical protein